MSYMLAEVHAGISICGNMSSREFVNTITKYLLGSCIFVFTPRGEIKKLPKGATILDYAYMIHTDIGNIMLIRTSHWLLMSIELQRCLLGLFQQRPGLLQPNRSSLRLRTGMAELRQMLKSIASA